MSFEERGQGGWSHCFALKQLGHEEEGGGNADMDPPGHGVSTVGRT